jgi:MazG family protein
MEHESLENLFDLIRTLRGENGCPWDRAQTVEDILSDLVEEAYELQWAHVHHSSDEVFEETGDVLFVLVFAIALLRENDPTFTVENIAAHAYEKIKRRHPHVFSDAVAKTETESLSHWNRVKAEEKRAKPQRARSFSDIPGNLSPIRRAEKMQRLAAGSGFDWPDAAGILRKIREEVNEVEELLASGPSPRLGEEIGDLFFSAINLSRFFNIDGEATLARANAKFAYRYSAMEELARRDGHVLKDLTLDEMDRYWEQAKKKLE